MTFTSLSRALCAIVLVTSGAVGAQAPTPPPGGDPIADNLFPPELVMQHQQEIGLTDDQRSYMLDQVQQAQRRSMDAQWQLQREVETMAELLRHDPIDEDRMLAQLDRILALEREIKRVHLTLVARIKNRLTADQRARLQAIRASGH